MSEEKNVNQKTPENSKKLKPSVIILYVLAGFLVLFLIILIITLCLPKPEPEVAIDNRSFEEMFWEIGDVNQAISEFQKKIDATKDNETKADLYAERANFLFLTYAGLTEEYNDLVLSDTQKSAELDPNEDRQSFSELVKSHYEQLENSEDEQ